MLIVNVYVLVLRTPVVQAKKCPRCKKDLKGMARVEKQLAGMHRDFRHIMDSIQEGNAEENIQKFSKLLMDIEKVLV